MRDSVRIFFVNVFCLIAAVTAVKLVLSRYLKDLFKLVQFVFVLEFSLEHFHQSNEIVLGVFLLPALGELFRSLCFEQIEIGGF